MNLAEILAEMDRSPDAHFLIEWIDGVLADFPDGAAAAIIRPAIAAYYAAQEG